MLERRSAVEAATSTTRIERPCEIAPREHSEPGAGMETGTIGRDLGFEIEGEIKGRQVLANPLPSYPEGLNQNAVIRIRIIVLPDGSVSSSGMVPVRKENARLEELTMEKLKLWRFSPLPEGQDDNQTGTVTFRFVVQ